MTIDRIEKRIIKDARKIIKYKNKYKGKRCFIIGNGPSLKMEDLNLLYKNNEICFGSHRIYLAFNNTKWRPNFYTIQDTKMMNEYYYEIEALKIKQKFVAYPYELHQSFPIFKSFLSVKMIFENFFPYCPNFSKDLSKGIYEGWTVSYFNIQLAVYMGFEKIYLLGIDHHYSKTKSPNGIIIENDTKDNFCDEYIQKNENRNLPQVDKSTLAYLKSNVLSRYNNFRIYNSTRGGKLEIFERVNFESIL